MRGRVVHYGGVCPKCGKEFETIRDSVTKDTINILCTTCYTMPIRYLVDGRPFKNRRGTVGRLFRDERGELLYSFHAAKRLLEAIRHDWDKNGPERFDPTRWARSGRESYKLKECQREWQIHLERSGKSKAYTVHVELFFRKHINPYLGELDIREICGDDIEKLQLTLKEKGLSQNTVKSCLQVLMSLMQRYHVRKQVLDKVPPFPEKWSATPQQDRWVVDEKTQREMWERMPKDTHLLMETLCALGCRPSEVCGLKKKDLLPDGRIMIQRSINVYGEEVQTKTGRTRVHILPVGLHNTLSGLPILPEGWLFSIGGKPFNPNRLSSLFRSNNRDVRGITLYTLSRHSLASRIAREAREEGEIRAAKIIGNTPSIARLHYIQE